MTSDESRMTFVESSTSATLCDTNVFGAERLESDVEATSFPGWLSCKPAHSQNLTQRILLKIKTTFHILTKGQHVLVLTAFQLLEYQIY